MVNEERRPYLREVASIGKLSDQILEILRNLREGKEIKREKYSQVSDKVFDFLMNKIDLLPEEEREIIISHLITTTKPNEQERLIESIEFLLLNKEEIEGRRKELKN